MSIFVTSLGATDNEICAPVFQSILNHMNTKGFRFRGLPAVEPHILLEKSQVGFTLNSCHLKTSLITFDFSEVSHFVDIYKQKCEVTEALQVKVKEKLDELEALAQGNCIHNESCAHCALISRELFC